jgi:tight adherence protein B
MDVLSAVFFVLVFIAVFLLLRALGEEVFSRGRATRRAVERIGSSRVEPAEPKLLRRPHLERLTPLERKIESRSELRWLRRLIEQAGLKVPSYQILFTATVGAGVSALLLALYWPRWWAFLVVVPMAMLIPFARLVWLRRKRMETIEAELADAIDMVKRSLRAGNPLVATFRMVADNMKGDLAGEFALTAADLSYGSDPRAALTALLDRVPSPSLKGFITAILVQRETGGNLAETLDHISAVIRDRFRFERKLRTLTAEGRLSAWILTSIPFVLAAILQFRAPDYLRELIDHPQGTALISGGGVLMFIGVVWMRQIIRIVI